MMEDFEIVDAHQHVGNLLDASSFSGLSGGALEIEQDAARRLRFMDAIGISWAILQPSHGYLKPEGLRDTMRLNDLMARYKQLAPDRFRAVLGTSEPMYGEAGLSEIERCKHELGLDGLSYHHRYQGCFIDSKWMWPTLLKIREANMPVLIHVNVESSMESHWRLERLARDFPDISFLAMDGLWSYDRCRAVLHSAARMPNVIWDFGGPAAYVSIEEWVGLNGSETLCFSADYSYGGSAESPRLLRQIMEAKIRDEDRRNILSGNMRRIFAIDGRGEGA